MTLEKPPRSPSRSFSPASERGKMSRHSIGKENAGDTALSPAKSPKKAPAPLAFLKLRKDVGESEGESLQSPIAVKYRPKSPLRKKVAEMSPGALALDKPAQLGRFAEVTAATVLKSEGQATRFNLPRSTTRTASPERRRLSHGRHVGDGVEEPKSPGVGFSFWTERQRPDECDSWLRHNTTPPFYAWGKSFDASSASKRCIAACWGRETSYRSQPEQWCRDMKRSCSARVDGLSPTSDLHVALKRTRDTRSQPPAHSRSPSRSPRPGDRALPSRSVSKGSSRRLFETPQRHSRSVSPMLESASRSAVPRPILPDSAKAEDKWRTHLHHKLVGCAGFHVPHPDWTANGGKGKGNGWSFGRSTRLACERNCRTSAADSNRAVGLSHTLAAVVSPRPRRPSNVASRSPSPSPRPRPSHSAVSQAEAMGEKAVKSEPHSSPIGR
eukprot:TRINITY_DN63040_c0_g1_i1.p1 TRINITY_DN63040_c0_g1~~TRINITY_DN63040_c0_g1_i1.p1  ORF type:complete len:454 (-),score=49.25 TRINITY_DN63040_c0_g1_i1:59-1381(-)